MKTKIISAGLAALLLLLPGCTGSKPAARQKDTREITALLEERRQNLGEPVPVAEFVECYNTLRGKTMAELVVPGKVGSNVVNVPVETDDKLDIALRLTRDGDVHAFSATVNMIQYDLPDDPAPVWEEMLPSLLTAMEVFGVDKGAWSEMESMEFTEYQNGMELRREYTGGRFGLFQLIAYTDWEDGRTVPLALRLEVYV